MGILGWAKRASGAALILLAFAKNIADWAGRVFLVSDHGKDLLKMIQQVPHQEIVQVGAVLVGVALLVPGSWWGRLSHLIGAKGVDDLVPIEEAGAWLYNHASARLRASLKAPEPQPIARGGNGGSGEIVGGSGTIIGGRGGRVGAGGQGFGGHGGGGKIEGGNGLIIGGEGGSVDGTHIWYPPAQAGGKECLEEMGMAPGWGEPWPGQGGMSGGYFEKHKIVADIRAEYFRAKGKPEKIEKRKIEDVPLKYMNAKLSEAGFDWRARIERKYWYLYYVPDAP